MEEPTQEERRGPRPPFPPQTQSEPGSEASMQPRPQYQPLLSGSLQRLQDKVALITGADSGIGRAVAVAFAREGADIAISYLNEHEDAKETARAVLAEGRRALLLPGDISSDQECERLVESTFQHLGHLDVLVNNAAKQGPSVARFEDLTPERVEQTFRTNIVAMYFLVRHALRHLRAGASIINVASIQAYHPRPSILDYAATKGAIVTFTKGLAKELIGRGIRVNCVAPGPVWTPLIPQSFGKEHVAHFGEHDPMERPAQPNEVAPAFVFLASDESRYIHGEVLGVTGGKPLP